MAYKVLATMVCVCYKSAKVIAPILFCLVLLRRTTCAYDAEEVLESSRSLLYPGTVYWIEPERRITYTRISSTTQIPKRSLNLYNHHQDEFVCMFSPNVSATRAFIQSYGDTCNVNSKALSKTNQFPVFAVSQEPGCKQKAVPAYYHNWHLYPMQDAQRASSSQKHGNTSQLTFYEREHKLHFYGYLGFNACRKKARREIAHLTSFVETPLAAKFTHHLSIPGFGERGADMISLLDPNAVLVRALEEHVVRTTWYDRFIKPGIHYHTIRCSNLEGDIRRIKAHHPKWLRMAKASSRTMRNVLRDAFVKRVFGKFLQPLIVKGPLPLDRRELTC